MQFLSVHTLLILQEELPPLHQVIPTKHNVKVVERVCSPDKSRQNLSKKYTEGNTFSKRKVTCNFVASKSEESIIFDDTFADHVNTSLSVIESIEFLNDSMSLLHIEQKNKKAGAVSIFKFIYLVNKQLQNSSRLFLILRQEGWGGGGGVNHIL